jgi:hypothetical protein
MADSQDAVLLLHLQKVSNRLVITAADANYEKQEDNVQVWHSCRRRKRPCANFPWLYYTHDWT